MTLVSICDWASKRQIAIEYQDLHEIVHITYAEINAARKNISEHLSGIDGFEFIGISYDVTACLVPSLMLGIMERGHAFVNVPRNPMLSKSLLVSLCVKYQFTYHVSSDMKIIASVNIHGNDIHLIKCNHTDKCILHDNSANYAYGISTSGSTGIPKIVRVPHSCIVPNILDLKRILCTTQSDKIAQFTSLTFDPSIIEIFLALSTGATLYVVSQSLKSDADRLLRETCQNKITVLQMTPSVLLHSWTNQSLKQSILSANTSLRVLLLGGERFPKTDQIFACKHPSNSTRIFNIYGITEVSCWASINEIDTVSCNPLYLGRPLSQTLFQVINEKGELISTGDGSLLIGSNERICVLDDESVDNLIPPVYRPTGDAVYMNEGKVYYKGRNTRVVKRFGNQIDLLLLEKTVLEHDFIQDSYALWEDDTHKLYLCVIITKHISKDINLNDIVMKCLNKLDPIYRPDKIKFFEQFDLTSNGKVCLEYLRKQCLETEGDTINVHHKTLKEIEKTFHAAWHKYFGPEMKGFIELGGSSVVALQISHSLAEDSKHEFPKLIGMLLNNSTFDDCLKYVGNSLAGNEKNKRTYSEDEELQDSSRATAKRSMTHKLFTAKNGRHGYPWQKCRGQIYGNTADVPYIDRAKSAEDVRILFSCNLRKCIDACPTVFQYPDGNLCATVGSHSGIICTVELMQKHPQTYEIKLPDRIEASVLVLNDFRGVVGCYDHCVYCVHLRTGEILWSFRTEDIVKSSAICSKDGKRIFLGSYDCHAYCISANDGAQIWKVKAGTGSITAAGCLHEPSESVLFGTLDGTCIGLQQSSGEVVWKRKLLNPIFVAPTVLPSGLVIFCTVAGVIKCFDIGEDTEIWNYSIDGNIFAYPIARYDSETNQETMIVASQNKKVYVLVVTKDGQSDKPALKNVIEFGWPIFATPWFNDPDLFVVCTNGTLSVCTLSASKPKEVIKLPGDVFSSPAVHSDYIFVGCRDDNLYVLELDGSAK